MRHIFAGVFCAVGFVSAAHAITTDYTVSKEINGFNLYEVAQDGVKLVSGSPFGSDLTTFVAADGGYIYAVQEVSPPPPEPSHDYNAKLVTYEVSNGKLKQVASIADNELASGACGSCREHISWITGSSEHLFMPVTYTSSSGASAFLHVLHKNGGGSVSKLCDIGVPFNVYSIELTSVTGVRVGNNDHYAYIGYIDYTTQAPMVGIYDLSTSACKHVGTIPQ